MLSWIFLLFVVSALAHSRQACGFLNRSSDTYRSTKPMMYSIAAYQGDDIWASTVDATNAREVLASLQTAQQCTEVSLASRSKVEEKVRSTAHASLFDKFLWKASHQISALGGPFMVSTIVCSVQDLMPKRPDAFVIDQVFPKRSRRPPNLHTGSWGLVLIFMLANGVEAQEPSTSNTAAGFRSTLFGMLQTCLTAAWTCRMGIAITLSAALMFTFAIVWMSLEMKLNIQKRVTNPKGYWVIFSTWIISTILYILIHCYRLMRHRENTEPHRRQPTLWSPVALYLLQTTTGIILMMLLLFGHFKEFSGHEVLTYLPACATLSAFSNSFWWIQGSRTSVEIGDTGVEYELSEPQTPGSAAHSHYSDRTDVEAGLHTRNEPESNGHVGEDETAHASR